MATKTRSTGSTQSNAADKIAEGQKEAFVTGTAFMKDNVEKAVQGYDTLTSFSKKTMEAYMESANVATKGIEAINSEALAFSKQSIEDTVSMTKAAMTAKSLEEVYAIQSDFAKTAADSYWNQMSKLGEMMTETMREAWEPITGQVQTFAKDARTTKSA